MLLLCLAVVSCGKTDEVTDEVTEASTTQAQDYGVPNPFEIVDTLDEAAKIAGFSLEAPTEYADYNSPVIQAIADDMIEVIYFDYSGYKEYEQLYPPFEHGVSILDLIFNMGEDAYKYLKSTRK